MTDDVRQAAIKWLQDEMMKCAHEQNAPRDANETAADRSRAEWREMEAVRQRFIVEWLMAQISAPQADALRAALAGGK